MHKIAIGSWAFAFGSFAKDPWELNRVLQWTKEAGYDGIELNGFRPHPHQDDLTTQTQCDELMREVSSYHLEVTGYAPDLTLVPPAIVETEMYLEQFRKCLRVCERCHIPSFRIDTVSPPDLLVDVVYEERFNRLVRTWRKAAEEAEKAGINIVWEFEPGFWLNKPSEVKRLVEAIGHSRFQLLFDSSHAYLGAVAGARHTGAKEALPGGLVEYVNMVAPYIGHIHLIDSDGTLHDEETSAHVHFGQGNIDFVELLKTLQSATKLLPWIGIDYCFNSNVIDDGKEAVPIVRSYLKEVYP
jgi:sugar phosphate isomerase/epimerase